MRWDLVLPCSHGAIAREGEQETFRLPWGKTEPTMPLAAVQRKAWSDGAVPFTPTTTEPSAETANAPLEPRSWSGCWGGTQGP